MSDSLLDLKKKIISSHDLLACIQKKNLELEDGKQKINDLTNKLRSSIEKIFQLKSSVQSLKIENANLKLSLQNNCSLVTEPVFPFIDSQNCSNNQSSETTLTKQRIDSQSMQLQEANEKVKQLTKELKRLQSEHKKCEKGHTKLEKINATLLEKLKRAENPKSRTKKLEKTKIPEKCTSQSGESSSKKMQFPSDDQFNDESDCEIMDDAILDKFICDNLPSKNENENQDKIDNSNVCLLECIEFCCRYLERPLLPSMKPRLSNNKSFLSTESQITFTTGNQSGMKVALDCSMHDQSIEVTEIFSQQSLDFKSENHNSFSPHDNHFALMSDSSEDDLQVSNYGNLQTSQDDYKENVIKQSPKNVKNRFSFDRKPNDVEPSSSPSTKNKKGINASRNLNFSGASIEELVFNESKEDVTCGIIHSTTNVKNCESVTIFTHENYSPTYTSHNSNAYPDRQLKVSISDDDERENVQRIIESSFFRSLDETSPAFIIESISKDNIFTKPLLSPLFETNSKVGTTLSKSKNNKGTDCDYYDEVIALTSLGSISKMLDFHYSPNSGKICKSFRNISQKVDYLMNLILSSSLDNESFENEIIELLTPSPLLNHPSPNFKGERITTLVKPKNISGEIVSLDFLQIFASLLSYTSSSQNNKFPSLDHFRKCTKCSSCYCKQKSFSNLKDMSSNMNSYSDSEKFLNSSNCLCPSLLDFVCSKNKRKSSYLSHIKNAYLTSIEAGILQILLGVSLKNVNNAKLCLDIFSQMILHFALNLVKSSSDSIIVMNQLVSLFRLQFYLYKLVNNASSVYIFYLKIISWCQMKNNTTGINAFESPSSVVTTAFVVALSSTYPSSVLCLCGVNETSDVINDKSSHLESKKSCIIETVWNSFLQFFPFSQKLMSKTDIIILEKFANLAKLNIPNGSNSSHHVESQDTVNNEAPKCGNSDEFSFHLQIFDFLREAATSLESNDPYSILITFLIYLFVICPIPCIFQNIILDNLLVSVDRIFETILSSKVKSVSNAVIVNLSVVGYFLSLVFEMLQSEDIKISDQIYIFIQSINNRVEIMKDINSRTLKVNIYEKIIAKLLTCVKKIDQYIVKDNCIPYH